MKYRKKPVVIEAIQFPPDGIVTREFLDFLGVSEDQAIPGESYNYWSIDTLEGTMKANRGDWIIKGVRGEFYPCKPDIFEATYEPVEGGA